LLICDEIPTGLCCTDSLACEYDKVCPDMILLSKVLSGGGRSLPASLPSQPPSTISYNLLHLRGARRRTATRYSTSN
ncbi:hypothetical protein B0H14DRAFT_2342987, partial [Mycena olivaceomarginata]